MKLSILNGAPGAGKTEALMRIMMGALDAGVEPTKIGFISFTRRALKVARGRAREKFGFHHKHLPFFKTMHAMAYSLVGHVQLMRGEYLGQFAHQTGIKIDGAPLDLSLDDVDASKVEGYYSPRGERKDDPVIELINYARNKYPDDAEGLWKSYNEKALHRTWEQVRAVADAYAQFRHSWGCLDHTDLLEEYLRRPAVGTPALDLLLIDEAQDLSNLQWRVAEKLMSRARRVVIVGDGDQAVFEWAGAAPERFVALTRNESTTLLGQSYRCPRRVQGLANLVAKQMFDRDPKPWKPTEEAGTLAFIPTIWEAPLHEGSWLVLARNNFTLPKIRDHLDRRMNFDDGECAFDWKDSISVKTIHRSKGDEADNILLYPELSTKEWINHDTDAELRTLYVALTRARHGLYVISPRQYERRYHIRDLLLGVSDQDLLDGKGKAAA